MPDLFLIKPMTISLEVIFERRVQYSYRPIPKSIYFSFFLAVLKNYKSNFLTCFMTKWAFIIQGHFQALDCIRIVRISRKGCTFSKLLFFTVLVFLLKFIDNQIFFRYFKLKIN